MKKVWNQFLRDGKPMMERGRYKKVLLVLGFCLIVFGIAWYFLIGDRIHVYYPSDLSYSFDLSSSDNFFDEAKGEYSGPQSSIATLSYEGVDNADNVTIVENIIEVRTLSGDPIFSVDRTYGVNALIGAHIAGYGDKTRDGYLFAPPNLQEGQSFAYWHINYDGPATMQFVSVEDIEGVAVFKYSALYDGVDIDQTDQLGHLPGVPVERGVRLKPTLTAWFEPITGKMIAYQDETTAYYYDQSTKEIIVPWNSFGNSVTEDSKRKQISLVQAEKFTLILQRYGMPIFLVLYGFGLVLHSWGRAKVDRMVKLYRIAGYGLAFMVLIGGILVAIGWFLDIDVLKSVVSGLVTMKFSTAVSFIAAALVVASYIRLRNEPSGLASIVLPSATLFLFLMMGTLLITAMIGVSSGIEYLFVQETKRALFSIAPGGPSIGTMVGFITIALFGVLAMIDSWFRRALMTILRYVVVLVGIIALTGYVFENPGLYFAGKGISSAMAFHTAFFFFMLGLAMIFGEWVNRLGKKP